MKCSPMVVYHAAARWAVAPNFQALFDLPEALHPYVPEFRYLLRDLSAYSDEEIKRTAELGIGLLILKHIFLPDLRARLPEVGCYGILSIIRGTRWAIWRQFYVMLRLLPKEFVLRMCG